MDNYNDFKRAMLTDASFRHGYDMAIKHAVAYVRNSAAGAAELYQKQRQFSPMAEYWRGVNERPVHRGRYNRGTRRIHGVDRGALE